MSAYLDLAKKATDKPAPPEAAPEMGERRRRKHEEAARRGLVVKWSEYPKWISLHDPATGEWHELRPADCLPSLVEGANRRRKGGAA